MRLMFFCLCLCLFPFMTKCQILYKEISQDNHAYKECVKGFYKLLSTDGKVTVNDFKSVAYMVDDTKLFLKECQKAHAKNECSIIAKIRAEHPDTTTSLVLSKIKNYKQVLTQGGDYELICSLICSATIFDEGLEFSMFLELAFPNGKSILFEMNKDTPKQILYIWISNVESLSDLVQKHNVNRLQRVGSVNDSDGYLNVRGKANNQSPVIGMLRRDEIFYYIEDERTCWWAVYREEGGKRLGYVHKSRILKYNMFPEALKEKVRRQRSGC